MLSPVLIISHVYKLEIPIDTEIKDGCAFLGAEIDVYVNDVLVLENPVLIPSYIDKEFILKDLHVIIDGYGDDDTEEESEQDDTSSSSNSPRGTSDVTTVPPVPEDIIEDDVVSNSENNNLNSDTNDDVVTDDNSITLSTNELNKITAQVIIDKITEPKTLMTSGAILFVIIFLMALVLLDKKKF